MSQQLFIPEKVNIGFQNRSDTYTGKLAYVIYFDSFGKLRKEKSWQSWRDSKIDPIIYENEPTEGFVLNKDVGGARRSYGWNCRNEYVRVYDPRDFEFEISIANLLFILRECDCSRGKGLEGKFVYAWQGTELVLLPVNSMDYEESKKFTKLQGTKISVKDLIPGGTYVTKSQDNLIYLGRFEKWSPYDKTYGYHNHSVDTIIKAKGKKHHVFWTPPNKHLPNGKFEFVDNMSRLGGVLSDTPVPELSDLISSYYMSKHGSKVVKLYLKNCKTNFKDTFAYEKNGVYVLYKNISHNGINTHKKVFLNGDVLHFETFYCESFPDDRRPTWYNRPTIPWSEHKPQKLYILLESGAEFKVTSEGRLV